MAILPGFRRVTRPAAVDQPPAETGTVEAKAFNLDSAPALSPMSTGQSVLTPQLAEAVSSSGSLPGPLKPGGVWDFRRAVQQAYEGCVWFNRAIEAKAQNAASREVEFYDKAGKVVQSDIADLLNGPRANPLESGPQLRHRLSLQLDLSPRGAFVEVTRSRAGKPVRLDLLPPGRTYQVPGQNGEIDHFEIAPLDNRRKPIEVKTEDVRWFHNVHPDDPRRSMTTIEAAGLTIELDYYARVYARSFVLNDGRPGTVIGVTGDLNDDEMDRIERKFGGGPTDGGRTTVLAGDLKAVDMATTPREADYRGTRLAGKDEILFATGVAESVAGNASGRTFANADQEWENFWVVTEVPWMASLCEPWQQDAPSAGCKLAHNLSNVAVLERHKAEKETREIELLAAGVQSIDQFLEATGRQPYDLPWTRCLWFPAGMTWLPAAEDDIEALKLLDAVHQPLPMPPGGTLLTDGTTVPSWQADPPPPLPALPSVDPTAVPAADSTDPTAGPPPDTSAADTVPTSGGDPPPPAASGTKALSTIDPEMQLDQELAALVDRMTNATVDRLSSVRARRGTKFHDGSKSDRTLDVAWAVNADTWRKAAVDLARPLLARAVLAAGDTVDATVPAGKALTPAEGAPGDAGQPPVDSGLEHPIIDAYLTEKAIALPLAGIADAVSGYADTLAAAAKTAADQAGAVISDVTGAVRAAAALFTSPGQQSRVSAAASHAVWLTGQQTAYLLARARNVVTKGQIVATWNTRHDDKVRPSHVAADGQKQNVGDPFKVGGALLRFPTDPLGPPEETIRCRCSLSFARA